MPEVFLPIKYITGTNNCIRPQSLLHVYLGTMEQDRPVFVPDKAKLWTWLEFIATEDPEVAAAHAGQGDATLLGRVVYKWTPHILDAAHSKWDRCFVEAILIEYCDPQRIAFPEAYRFEELLKQWEEGLFCPEPI